MSEIDNFEELEILEHGELSVSKDYKAAAWPRFVSVMFGPRSQYRGVAQCRIYIGNTLVAFDSTSDYRNETSLPANVTAVIPANAPFRIVTNDGVASPRAIIYRV